MFHVYCIAKIVTLLTLPLIVELGGFVRRETNGFPYGMLQHSRGKRADPRTVGDAGPYRLRQNR